MNPETDQELSLNSVIYTKFKDKLLGYVVCKKFKTIGEFIGKVIDALGVA